MKKNQFKAWKNKLLGFLSSPVPESWLAGRQENWQQGIIKLEPKRMKKALKEGYRPSDVPSDISYLFSDLMQNRLYSEGYRDLPKAVEKSVQEVLAILMSLEPDLTAPTELHDNLADSLIGRAQIPQITALVVLETLKQTIEKTGTAYEPNFENIFRFVGAEGLTDHPMRKKYRQSIKDVHRAVWQYLPVQNTPLAKELRERHADKLSFWTTDIQFPALEDLPFPPKPDTRTAKEILDKSISESLYEGRGNEDAYIRDFLEKKGSIAPSFQDVTKEGLGEMVKDMQKEEANSDNPFKGATAEDVNTAIDALIKEEERGKGGSDPSPL